MVGWFNALTDTLWPARCVGCAAPGSWWCANCDARVIKITEVRCFYCGRQTIRGTSCAGCRGTGPLTGIAAGAEFVNPLPSAVKALKYRHARAVAPSLMPYLLPVLARIGADPAELELIPVPLHPSRERRRGHNQAAVLAELASRRAGILYRHGLERIRNTPTQTGLTRTERFQNVAGAFEWAGPDRLNETVVLVDDVVTTGATFEAAAAACRAAGAGQVWGLAVGRQPLRS